VNPQGARRRGLLAPSLAALCAFALLVALGTWQVERKAWKEGLIAALTERLSAPPVPLPPPAAWASLDPAKDEFRRVAFTGEFAHDQEALVYTAGSSLRDDVAGPGYWVFTPARLPGGEIVMVDRGFVPEGRQAPATRAQGQVTGKIEIVGVMRWPEARGMFTPADEPAKNIWFVRDPAAMAAAKHVGAIAPFYIDQEAPPVPGGLPRGGKLHPSLPNNHLGYAVTWYGLALVLVVAFGAWIVSRRREI
jgi:surfeit locus 1 family protein